MGKEPANTKENKMGICCKFVHSNLSRRNVKPGLQWFASRAYFRHAQMRLV